MLWKKREAGGDVETSMLYSYAIISLSVMEWVGVTICPSTTSVTHVIQVRWVNLIWQFKFYGYFMFKTPCDSFLRVFFISPKPPYFPLKIKGHTFTVVINVSNQSAVAPHSSLIASAPPWSFSNNFFSIRTRWGFSYKRSSCCLSSCRHRCRPEFPMTYSRESLVLSV